MKKLIQNYNKEFVKFPFSKCHGLKVPIFKCDYKYNEERLLELELPLIFNLMKDLFGLRNWN